MSAADPIPKIIRTNTFTKKLPDLFAPKKKQKLAIDTAVEARQCNSKESDDRLGSTVDLGYLSPTGDLRRTAFRNSLEYNDNFQTSTRTGTSIAASGTSYGSIDRVPLSSEWCWGIVYSRLNKSTRGILGVEDPVVDSKDQDYKDAVAFDTFESIFSDASPVVRKLVSTSDSDAVLESEEIGDLQNLYRPGSLPELLERLRKLRDADPTDIAPTSIAGRKPINYRELVNRVLKKILKIFELKDSPQYKEASAVPMQVWEAAVSAMERKVYKHGTIADVDEACTFANALCDSVGSGMVNEALFSVRPNSSSRNLMKRLPELYHATILTSVAFCAGGESLDSKLIEVADKLRGLIFKVDLPVGKKAYTDAARREIKNQELRRTVADFAFFEYDVPMRDSRHRWTNIRPQVTDRQRLEPMKEWLADASFRERHEGTRKVREEFGAEIHVLRQPIAVDWFDATGSSLLWLYGAPGTGKSVLTSLVIDTLQGTYRKSNAVLYFYCNYSEPNSRTATRIIRALFKQLIEIQQYVDLRAVAAYERLKSKGTESQCFSLQDMKTTFIQQLPQRRTTFIVIDAIDECGEEQQGRLLDFFDTLLNIPASPVKAFFTSRNRLDQDKHLKDIKVFQTETRADVTQAQIEGYTRQMVRKKVSQKTLLSGAVDSNLEETIVKTIVQSAGGSFVAANLQIKRLDDIRDRLHLTQFLHSATTNIEDLYESMLMDMDKLTEDEQLLAHTAFQWLLGSTTPMTIDQIREAAALEPNGAFDPENKPAEEYILRVCCNFVKVQSGKFTFVHSSVQGFLSEKIPENNKYLMQICLTALMESSSDFTSSRSGFYYYAATNWDKHVKALGKVEQEEEMLIRQFFHNSSAYHRWFDYRRDLDEELQRFYENEAFAEPIILSCSAFLGMTPFLEVLLSLDIIDAVLAKDSKNYAYGQALVFTSLRGDIISTQRLLQLDSNINFVSKRLGTPLQAAIRSMNVDVIKLLLANNPDVSVEGGELGNALITAAWMGEKWLVEALIEKGADVDAQAGIYGNAFQAAAANGNVEIAKLLHAKGAKANASGGRYGNALQAATLKGNLDMVELLLEIDGTEINAEGGRYGTALQAAVWNENADLATLLVSRGANVTVNVGSLGTPLEIASLKGNETIAGMLLANGAPAFQRGGGRYAYPLQAAALFGDDEIAVALLEGGAEINAKGGEFGYALQAAAAKGHAHIVKILLEAQTQNDELICDVNARGGYYYTALQAATWNGHGGIVQMLLDRGADVNVQGGPYHSVLYAAALQGDEFLVKTFLRSDVNVKLFGGAALQAAASRGAKTIVQLLLDAGADINEKAGVDGTSVQAASWSGDKTAVGMLLNDKSQLGPTAGPYGTALQAAVLCGDLNLSIVQLLLDRGADINAEGGTYHTALQAAAVAGAEQIVKLLLEYPVPARAARVNTIGGKWGTALQAACQQGSLEVVRLLLNHKANFFESQSLGFYGTPLQAAAIKGHKEVVWLLLQKGYPVNQTNAFGETALHFAAYHNHYEVVKTLLLNGATITATTERSSNIFHVVALVGSTRMLKLLMKQEEPRLKELAQALDRNRWTPAMIASRINNPSMAYELERNSTVPSNLKYTKKPTAWSMRYKHPLLKLSNNNLTVSMPRHAELVEASAQADFCMPFPTDEPNGKYFYFEVEIQDLGKNGAISLGVCYDQKTLTFLPGREVNSWGLSGQDGNTYCGHMLGENYTDPFRKGDVIGCCRDYENDCVFFTRNGKRLRTAFKNVLGNVYPQVGLMSPGAKVTANFGKKKFLCTFGQSAKKG